MDLVGAARRNTRALHDLKAWYGPYSRAIEDHHAPEDLIFWPSSRGILRSRGRGIREDHERLADQLAVTRLASKAGEAADSSGGT